MKDNNKNDISIKLEKQALIREEIINKGYDSIQFIEYLIQCKGPGGENINSWSIDELKNAIRDFIYINKNKLEKNNNYEINNIEKPIITTPLSKSDMPAPAIPQEKNITESVLSNIIDLKNNIFSDNSKKIEKIDYGLETPDILDCRSIDNTELTILKEVYIKIGFPEKISGGFFGRDNVSFTVATIPLGFVVKRNYFDFEWLRNILFKLYSGNFIPSLPQIFMFQKKDKEDDYFKECTRNLEKFMNYLILDPIIKNSQILYDFLCVENEKEFQNKQKEYENTTPSNDIQNYQSINGKIDINITTEKENEYKNIKAFCSESEKLYKQINNNLNSVEDDFNNIIKKLKETSLIWEKLNKLSQNDFQKEIYFELQNTFNVLGKSFKRENDLLKIDIKENFYFFANNINNFSQLFHKVDEYKRIFTKEEKDLISLKNDLFTKTNIANKEEDNIDLSKFLPRNTEATLEMKKNYGYYLNRVIIEFERMNNLERNLLEDIITKCFRTQNDIIYNLQQEIKKIKSTVEKLEIKRSENSKQNEQKKTNKKDGDIKGNNFNIIKEK